MTYHVTRGEVIKRNVPCGLNDFTWGSATSFTVEPPFVPHEQFERFVLGPLDPNERLGWVTLRGVLSTADLTYLVCTSPNPNPENDFVEVGSRVLKVLNGNPDELLADASLK